MLGRGRWDAEALVGIVRDYVVETLADPDAVLVIDETGFLKQGKASCGVGRQYTGSAGSHHFGSWGDKPLVAGTAGEIATGLAACAWTRLSAGEGTKGPRLPDWAYCELADLDAGEYDAARSGLWIRGLLIRRNIADGDLAFFATGCPAGTGIDTLVMPAFAMTAAIPTPPKTKAWRTRRLVQQS